MRRARFLAHHIIFEGKDYGFSIAEISPDKKKVGITSFEREVADTVFISGTLIIKKNSTGEHFAEKA